MRMSAVEAMGCAAEPVGRGEAGHCLFSSSGEGRWGLVSKG